MADLPPGRIGSGYPKSGLLTWIVALRRWSGCVAVSLSALDVVACRSANAPYTISQIDFLHKALVQSCFALNYEMAQVAVSANPGAADR